MPERGASICQVVCFNRAKIAALKERLPPVEDLQRKAERLKAVAHPGRLAVLFTLARSECCVCDLSNVLGQPVSTVSQHLRILKAAGFVRCRHAGKLVFYSVTGSASEFALRNGPFVGSPKQERTKS
jgi:ArsR family transcriptional regulator, lead/cadmium/zinc/bismuth-responsive transcriptional repressor